MEYSFIKDSSSKLLPIRGTCSNILIFSIFYHIIHVIIFQLKRCFADQKNKPSRVLRSLTADHNASGTLNLLAKNITLIKNMKRSVPMVRTLVCKQPS